MIEPGGRYLYVCNQGNGEIRPFRIDQETGLLSQTGQAVRTATPVWLLLTGPVEAEL